MKIETNKIHYKNCLIGMQHMKDDSVDITITSPPYNLGKATRGNMYTSNEDKMSEDEYFEFNKKVIMECIRVSKKYVFYNIQMLKGNKNSLLKIFGELKEYIKDIIIWDKDNVQPSIQPNCLNSKFEFIIVFSKKELAENRSFEHCNDENFNNMKKGIEQTHNVIHSKSSAHVNFKGRNENKAIFPVEIPQWFIGKFTYENDIVLDPFMGTGTTAIACANSNRKFIGFEINKRYIKIAENRLKNEQTLQCY